MTWKLVFFLCLFMSTAHAADVDPERCRDIDQTTRHLVPKELHGWYKYRHGVQACPVFTEGKRFLWWIITIRTDLLGSDEYNDAYLHPLNPDGFTTRLTPEPYIITMRGKILGRLTDMFPADPPGHTEVFLSQWQNDFPYHIDVKVKNAAAMGDYDAPSLQWNASTGHYDKIGQGWRDLPPPHKQQ
ncbi:MAG: hypothetical protein P4L66_01365 [Acetobacteraceae bacterium]|nr:hypothetical protein [Acetobacteraceae bacterium]